MSSIDRPGLLQRVLGGGDGAGQHEHRVGTARADVVDAGPRLQAVVLHGLLGREQHRAGAVGDLAGHRGGQPAALDERLEPGHLLQRRVARTLVGDETVDRDDLVLEVPGADRLLRALVTGERVLLHLLAREVPLLGDQLRAAELGDLLVAVAVQPALRLVGRRGEAELLADDHRRADRDLAHVLHAAGDDQVGGAGHDRLRTKGNGLLARPALPVDGDAGHLFGEAGGQPRQPGDVACLPPMASTQPAMTSSTAPGSTSLRSNRPRQRRRRGRRDARPASAPLRLPTAVRTASMTYACEVPAMFRLLLW